MIFPNDAKNGLFAAKAYKNRIFSGNERKIKMRIAICDDDKNGQTGLYTLIKNSGVFDDVRYLFFDSGTALLNSVTQGEHYSIVFLDVDMPEMGGIETALRINEADAKTIIIFYSAYPQFAVDAFDCNAFHYIVKGIDEGKFREILVRALRKYKRLNASFTVKTKTGFVSVPIGEIYYIEYLNKHLVVHTEKDSYETRDSLVNAGEKLFALGFYQCHQSYIVNFEKVHAIMKNEIVLTNGEKVMLSTRKRTETVSAYNRYLENFVL